MKPRVSIVVPAYNEGAAIEEFLGRVLEAVELPCELLVVVDTPDDTTLPYVEKYARQDPRARLLLNTLGTGSGPGHPVRDRAVAGRRGRGHDGRRL